MCTLELPQENLHTFVQYMLKTGVFNFSENIEDARQGIRKY